MAMMVRRWLWGKGSRSLSSSSSSSSVSSNSISRRGEAREAEEGVVDNISRYREPESFIGSWVAPADPRLAQKKLSQLRKDYRFQVRLLRKQYIAELEQKRADEHKKELATKAALLLSKQERRLQKQARVALKSAQRQASDHQLRLTLEAERAEKLEKWRRKEGWMEKNKKAKEEKVKRESSNWVEEGELEQRIITAVTTGVQL